MRRLPLSLFLFFCLAFPAFAGEPPALVIQKVNVVPMDEERVLEDRTVVVENGVIRKIFEGDNGEIPSGAHIVDGSGKYLMPGLAEMHAHVPGGGEEESYRHDVLYLYLANGVTLIRGMLGDPIHLELRKQLAKGEIDGPRLITAGPAFSSGSAPSPERGAALAREQAEAGYDFIKVISGSREAFEAMAEAAREIGIPFSGHVPAPVGVPGALEAGYASIDHLDAYIQSLVDPEKTSDIHGGFFGFRLAPHVEDDRMREIVRRTVEAGVWNVPTESLMHSVLTVELDGIEEARPEFRYMPPRIVEGWLNAVRQRREDPRHDPEAAEAFIQVRLDLIRSLHRAGAGLLLGSDAPQFFNVPGFSLHREMEILTGASLSPFEILQTGTVNPAVFFGEEDEFGRVAEGMRADLVLLEANPLEDIGNAARIAGVIRAGKWFSQEELAERLEEIAGRQAP